MSRIQRVASDEFAPAQRSNAHSSLKPSTILCALAAIGAGAQVVAAWKSNQVGTSELFVDDAYYYFGIARHIFHGHGSTFGGADHTNGYHPLWLLTLLPIFAIFQGRIDAIIGVKVVAGLLWIAALRQLGSIAETVNARLPMVIGSLPIALYGAAFPRSLPFAGVETGLVLVALLGAIAALVRVGERTQSMQFFGIGIWFASAVASRLDTIAVVVMLAAWATCRVSADGWAARAKNAIVMLAPPVVVASLSLIWNRVWFNAWITVSSRTKTLGGGAIGHGVIHNYFEQPRSLPTIVGIGSVSALAAASTYFACFARRKRCADSGARLRLAEVLCVVWLAEFATTIVFDAQSSWPQWPWYFYCSFIVLLVAPGLFLASLCPGLEQNVVTWFKRRGTAVTLSTAPQRAHRALRTIGLPAFGIAAAVGLGMATKVQANGSENFYTQNGKAVIELTKILPRGAVIAMGDRAGVVGYLLDRPMVQLEGIVDSNEYLDALQRGDAGAFLAQRHVAYYVKSSHRADHLPTETDGGPDVGAHECGVRTEPFFGAGPKVLIKVCRSDIVYTSTTPAGEQLVVWRYRGTRP